MKSTVPNYSTYWTSETSLSWEKTPKVILTWSDCPKFLSVLLRSFKLFSKVAAPKELHPKILLTVSLQDRMLSCKFLLKTVKKALERYISLIWPVIKEAPITWTWKNKPKSMDNKSISLCSNSNNVFVASIKEKITCLSEAPNSPCASKTPLSASAELSWSATSLLHQPAAKTL